MAQLVAAADAQLADWYARDPDGEIDFVNDLNALRKRYQAARDMLSPRSLQFPPEVIWNAILKALKQAWNPDTQTGPQSKGDFQELDSRLRSAGGSADYSKTPQPTVPDRDLQMFKAADVVARTIEKGAHDWTPLLLLALAWHFFGRN